MSRKVGAGRRLVLAALAVLATVTFTRATLAEPMSVGSASMSPTFDAGDVVIVDKITPRLDELHRRDVIVFASPRDGLATVKRVAGLPGDRVAIRDGVLFVAGRRVAEPVVDHRTVDGLYFGPVMVPAGHVFVLGDNRAESIDSRDFGPVAREDVQGRVAGRLWPPFSGSG